MRSLARTTLFSAGALCVSLAPLGCGSSASKSATTAPGRAAAEAKTNPSSTVVATLGSASPQGSAKHRDALCAEITNTYNRTLGHAATAGHSPAALRKSYETNGRKNQAVLAGSPVQIRPDLRTLLAASSAVADALAKVGYDANKLSQNARAPLDTPPVKAASAHVFAYISHGCAITVGAPSTGASN